VDINQSFQKKHGFQRADQGYPVFLLAYISMLNANPTMPQNKLVASVNKLSSKAVDELWKSYVAFRKSHEAKGCFKEDMVRNHENGRCMKQLSKSYVKLLKEKPPKPCKPQQMYSSLLEKCVDPKKNIDIDVLSEELANIKYNPNKKLQNIDSNAVLSARIMVFLMSKYPYAKFILPKDIPIPNIEKEDFKIYWEVRDGVGEVEFPNGYWDMFKTHVNDPSCRFIISSVTLFIKGHRASHANALIYDKTTNEIERFDPLTLNLNDDYHIEDFDKEYKTTVAHNVPSIFSKMPKYYEPLKYCPKKRILQSMEAKDIPGIDVSGNCAVWTWWYINVRLANPSVKRKDVVEIASKKLENMGGLYKFIKSYQQYMFAITKKKTQSDDKTK
jgi:hypothetical protein